MCLSEPAHNALAGCAGGATAQGGATAGGCGALSLQRQTVPGQQVLSAPPRGSGWETPRCRDDWPAQAVPPVGLVIPLLIQYPSMAPWPFSRPCLTCHLSPCSSHLAFSLLLPDTSKLSPTWPLCTCCFLQLEHPAWLLRALQISAPALKPSLTTPSKALPPFPLTR